MTLALTMEELFTWDRETSAFWKAHLDADPAQLALPCYIAGVSTVQELVRHIWLVELRWAQRLAGIPQLAKEDAPQGPLDALFDFHINAVEIFSGLLADSTQQWEDKLPLNIPSLPERMQYASRRKVAAHMLLHSQRHWAQLATLVRAAGCPSGFRGDILASAALD
jgi:uncharacterized damage-inducible protein DinB